jgi:hypothetical protein
MQNEDCKNYGMLEINSSTNKLLCVSDGSRNTYTFLSSPMRATCPAHLIRLDLKNKKKKATNLILNYLRRPV